MVDIEIVAQDVRGAQIAKAVGADRIELCVGLSVGGLTPSIALIEQAVHNGPDVHVLIRPRPGGFVYSDEEKAIILADVKAAMSAGAKGVVIGSLTEEALPDLDFVARCRQIVGDDEVTFHRAIDVSADVTAAARVLADAEVDRILTSGGAPSAFEGRTRLTDLMREFGERIQIQAGAGISPTNVADIAATGVAAVHFSGSTPVAGNPPPGGVDFGGYTTTDQQLVEETIAVLRNAGY